MVSTIKQHWQSQAFNDTRSYTKMPYPPFVAEVGQNWFRDSTIAIIRERTQTSHPFQRVVDLGCSVGDWTLRYLDFAEAVTGADINPNFIEQARKSASASEAEDRATFEVADIGGWTDFDRADFIALGAVLTCLDAAEVTRLLQRAAQAQSPGDWMYVRATVLNPRRKPFSTNGGYYRRKSFYQDLFGEIGYEPVFEAYSSTLATAGALVRAGASLPTARAAMLGLNVPLMGARFIKRDLDYCNWLLRRR